MKRKILLTSAAAVALIGTSVTVAQAGGSARPESAAGGSLLDDVIARGTIRCGVRNDLPGFNSLDDSGNHIGFDADFCRVIAAGILGDADAVEFVDVATADRFTALQAGEIDVLSRNTTWTASRDGGEGATFVATTFYDGQGMMVASDSGYESLDDMDGAVVCVAAGTTTEGNVRTEFDRRGLGVDVQSFDNPGLVQDAFVAGQCDGWSSDFSQLVSLRSAYPEAEGGPEALTLLAEIFSKEPLGVAVADGDTRFAQAVQWSVFAAIQAEEWGITSENAAELQSGSDNPLIVQFLGGPNAEGTVLDPGLGLPTDFAFQIVTQVGNYGEIFDRNVAPLGVERGVNALWIDGGLQYAPPYR